LFFLGGNCLKFTSLINGRPQKALVDTRAGGPAMDETHARKIDIPIAQDPAHNTTVQFADGTTAKTSSMAYGVRWQFGLAGDGKEYLLDFYILKNAPSNNPKR
jgi:hypothetical protein